MCNLTQSEVNKFLEKHFPKGMWNDEKVTLTKGQIYKAVRILGFINQHRVLSNIIRYLREDANGKS